MDNPRHKLLNSIREQLELGVHLSWLEERQKNFFTEIGFDIIFGYDDMKRTLDKTLRMYCDNYHDKSEEYDKLIEQLIKIRGKE